MLCGANDFNVYPRIVVQACTAGLDCRAGLCVHLAVAPVINCLLVHHTQQQFRPDCTSALMPLGPAVTSSSLEFCTDTTSHPCIQQQLQQQHSAQHMHGVCFCVPLLCTGVNDIIKELAMKISHETGYRCLIPDLYKGKIGVDAEEASHVSHAAMLVMKHVFQSTDW